MRAGIVGFGKMGMMHGALLQAMEGVELAAIADTSKFVLNGFRSVFPGVRTFTSYEKMIEQCPLDAVVVATPSFSHAAVGCFALERGLHVLMEKPLANRADSAKLLENASRARPELIGMVGFCMRYNPVFAKGKELFEEGTLGEFVSARGSMYCSDVLSRQSGWRFDPDKSGGGVLIDFAIHMVDLMYDWFGMPEAVSGETRKIHSDRVEDEVRGKLHYHGGREADLHASWCRPEYRKPVYKLEVRGTRGEMSVSDQELTLRQDGMPPRQWFYPDLYRGSYIDIGGLHFSIQMERFVRAVREGRQPETDFSHALRVQRIIQAFYDSAAQRGAEIECGGDTP